MAGDICIVLEGLVRFAFCFRIGGQAEEPIHEKRMARVVLKESLVGGVGFAVLTGRGLSGGDLEIRVPCREWACVTVDNRLPALNIMCGGEGFCRSRIAHGLVTNVGTNSD